MKLYALAGISAAVAAAFATQATAAVLLNEPFTYSDGAIETVGTGWTIHSGTGSKNVSAGAFVIDDDTTSDYNKGLSSTVSSGTVYASFDVTFSTSDIPGSGTALYFAHFKDNTLTTGTAFRTRIFANRPTGSAAGKFTLGLASIGGGTNAADFSAWSPTLDLGTTYKIVTSFNVGTGVSTLWVNPVSEASTSITSTGGSGQSIGAYAFRVAGNTDGDKTVDNLLVGTTFGDVVPEPASFGLGALVAGGLLVRRRRRA